METSYALLKDIIINSELIMMWHYKHFNDFRLYYKPTIENKGFYFLAVEWVTNDIHTEEWGPETGVDIVCSGWAAFDGIRHLHFGAEQTENVGYFNYPDIDSFVWLTGELKNLQSTYCSDYMQTGL